MDSARIIATVVFVGSLILLGDAWLKKDQSLVAETTVITSPKQTISTIPQATINEISGGSENQPSSTGAGVTADYIQVTTDVFSAKIDRVGAGIKELVLTQHHSKDSKTEALKLFE